MVDIPVSTDLQGRLVIRDDVRIVAPDQAMPKSHGVPSLVVHGDVVVSDGVDVPWTLEVGGDVQVGKACRIQGDLLAEGDVQLLDRATVVGHLTADTLRLAPGAQIKGRASVAVLAD